jgi:hypothetical protein
MTLTFPPPRCCHSLPLPNLRCTSRWCSQREAVVVKPLPVMTLLVPRRASLSAPLRALSPVVLGHARLFFEPTSPPIRVVGSATSPCCQIFSALSSSDRIRPTTVLPNPCCWIFIVITGSAPPQAPLIGSACRSHRRCLIRSPPTFFVRIHSSAVGFRVDPLPPALTRSLRPRSAIFAFDPRRPTAPNTSSTVTSVARLDPAQSSPCLKSSTRERLVVSSTHQHLGLASLPHRPSAS